MMDTRGFVRSQKTFGSHTMLAERLHPVFGDGMQYVALFPNGYGASIVRFPGSYGSREGLWELAVINADGEYDDNTPIIPGDHIMGYLDDEGVATTLDRLSALPQYVSDRLTLPGNKPFLALPEGD